jgi:hypothetical protein
MGEIPRIFTVTVDANACAPGELERRVTELDRQVGRSQGSDEPAFEIAGIAARLRDLGYPAPPRSARFETTGLLGTGANGRVYAVRDHDLDRPVAVKLLSEERPSGDELARFVEEARITASLEHPNVLPVHDIALNSRGQAYFTMKRIEGRSLGDALGESSPGRRLAPLDDHNALVNVVSGVCQALALAHRRRIVHQDVKPDNIMLGEFGEVLLVDWGSAQRLDAGAPRLYGTPLYMSPEQARRERADERSDVYCVGATLFHALTLRPPTWDDDAERFWTRKRAGELDEPTLAERAAVPAPLLAIALKALQPRPEQRYADAGALLEDLRRFQAGVAVSAWREPWWRRARRWHHRNRRALWSWTAAGTVLLTLVAALWGERLQEMATWGDPIVDERFADDSWRERWLPGPGSFERRGTRMVSTGGGDNLLVLKERLQGDIAVEYEAEMLPGGHPCDISLIWARDRELSPDGRRVVKLVGVYDLQVGAYDGAYTAIALGDTGRQVAVDPFRPEPGRRYRMRIEVVGDRLSLAVDGRVLCEWVDQFPVTGGYIALRGYYEEKAFGPVRVYSARHGLPEKVRATAIGDATASLVENTDDPAKRSYAYGIAAHEYEMVATSHPETRIGREALYKQGLCLWLDGQHERAFALWRPLRGGEFDAQVRVHDIEEALAAKDVPLALSRIEQLAAVGSEGRHLAAMRWADGITPAIALDDHAQLQAYLETHDRCLASESAVDFLAGTALKQLGRPEEVLRRYPYQRCLCAQALAELGRGEELVERYPDQRGPYTAACAHMGLYERMDYDFLSFQGHEALVLQGRGEEVLTRFPEDHENCAYALIALGRLDELLERYPEIWYHRARALCLLGRTGELSDRADATRFWMHQALGEYDEMQRDPHTPPDRLQWARCGSGLEAWIAGDRAAARERFAAPPIDPTAATAELAWPRCILAPYLEGLASGDWSALDRSLDDLLAHHRYTDIQRYWHMAAYLAGRIDDRAFLAQPVKAWTPGRLLLLRAMRRERLGDRAGAAADYAALLALPAWRRGEEPDALRDRFVSWRLSELRPPP